MNLDDLEVIWPLDKWHYLSPSLYLTETDMADDVTCEATTPVSTPGRDLAVRALLDGAACTQRRIANLLETSRRSIGRAAGTDLGPVLHDTAVVADARTVLAATARCGSTTEEREQAETWLAEALQNERAIETTARRTPAGRSKKKPAPKGAIRPTNGTARPPAAFPIPAIEAVERQTQRILQRTALIDYVLVGELRNGAALTLGDALVELVGDISDAAREVGTILQQTTKRAALH